MQNSIITHCRRPWVLFRFAALSFSFISPVHPEVLYLLLLFVLFHVYTIYSKSQSKVHRRRQIHPHCWLHNMRSPFSYKFCTWQVFELVAVLTLLLMITSFPYSSIPPYPSRTNSLSSIGNILQYCKKQSSHKMTSCFGTMTKGFAALGLLHFWQTYQLWAVLFWSISWVIILAYSPPIFDLLLLTLILLLLLLF